MAKIVVIDDDKGLRETTTDILEMGGHTVLAAEDALVGLELIERHHPDVVVLDVFLPRLGGLEALTAIKRKRDQAEVIVVSGHGSIDIAVRALKLGAYDFIEKPLIPDKLLVTVKNAVQIHSLKNEVTNLKLFTGMKTNALIGESPPMLVLKEKINLAAACESKILISGENGTGKELVARQICALGKRASKPFIAVNCAAIPDSLLESEMFGHEKGAFTDAHSQRLGRFELANQGTLFLDEVADLSLLAQAKVLRVLQDMRFERLGGDRTIQTDARIIAATNKDIRAEVAAGRFREDLYFRLAVIPIHVPPLRERKEDIALLCKHFLGRAGLAGAAVKEITPDALVLIREHEWSGNIRELANFIERLAVLSDEVRIDSQTISRLFAETPSPRRRQLEDIEGKTLFSLHFSEARQNFEKQYLGQKLRECNNNLEKTAEAAGLDVQGLRSRLRKFGFNWKLKVGP